MPRTRRWTRRLKRRLQRWLDDWNGTRRGMWLGVGLLGGIVALLGLASCLQRSPENEALLVPGRLEKAPRIRVALMQGTPSFQLSVEGGFRIE